MNSSETLSWITSIEDAAQRVISLYGPEEVSAVFRKYRATCVEDLSPCYYCDVFDELDIRATDN